MCSRGGFVAEGPQGPEVTLRGQGYLRAAVEAPTTTLHAVVFSQVFEPRRHVGRLLRPLVGRPVVEVLGCRDGAVAKEFGECSEGFIGS